MDGRINWNIASRRCAVVRWRIGGLKLQQRGSRCGGRAGASGCSAAPSACWTRNRSVEKLRRASWSRPLHRRGAELHTNQPPPSTLSPLSRIATHHVRIIIQIRITYSTPTLRTLTPFKCVCCLKIQFEVLMLSRLFDTMFQLWRKFVFKWQTGSIQQKFIAISKILCWKILLKSQVRNFSSDVTIFQCFDSQPIDYLHEISK